MTPVVAVAGAIASGKTELARELARRWDCPRASFGALVAAEAAARNAGQGRDALQALGSRLIDELGWSEFCRRTLELAGADSTTDPLVVDGIRHPEALAGLRAYMRTPTVYLVFVECALKVRTDRQRERGATPEEISRWDRHPTEAQLPLLRRVADVVVRGDGPVAASVDAVEGALESES